jgi:hypothetical protein
MCACEHACACACVHVRLRVRIRVLHTCLGCHTLQSIAGFLALGLGPRWGCAVLLISSCALIDVCIYLFPRTGSSPRRQPTARPQSARPLGREPQLTSAHRRRFVIREPDIGTAERSETEWLRDRVARARQAFNRAHWFVSLLSHNARMHVRMLAHTRTRHTHRHPLTHAHAYHAWAHDVLR